MTYRSDLSIKLYKCVYSCEFGKKSIDMSEAINVGK